MSAQSARDFRERRRAKREAGLPASVKSRRNIKGLPTVRPPSVRDAANIECSHGGMHKIVNADLKHYCSKCQTSWSTIDKRERTGQRNVRGRPAGRQQPATTSPVYSPAEIPAGSQIGAQR